MNITFDKNEMVDNKTAAGLLLFYNHLENTEGTGELLNNHIENYYTFYNYLIGMSNYRVEHLALDSCKELNRIHQAFTNPLSLSFNERKEIMEPYRKDIIDRIVKARNSGRWYIPRPLTYTYIDMFSLNMELGEIEIEDIERHNNRNASIPTIYKYIFKPVMDGEVKLDSETRKLIFHEYVSQVLRLVKNCSCTNYNLNTIKSIFCDSTNILQLYLYIYDYINDHFEELGCDEHMEKKKFESFHKKFNKWVCNQLIK